MLRKTFCSSPRNKQILVNPKLFSELFIFQRYIQNFENNWKTSV